MSCEVIVSATPLLLNDHFQDEEKEDGEVLTIESDSAKGGKGILEGTFHGVPRKRAFFTAV